VPSHFRLMTYNIGGARRQGEAVFSDVVEVVRRVSPDILAVQEVVSYTDADGNSHNLAARLAEAAGFGRDFFFGPVLSLRKHMDVAKLGFVEAIFADFQEWEHGNAIYCRAGFRRFCEPEKSGAPVSVPLYVAPLYRGNRDTEPRHAVLARVAQAPIYPFVLTVHLTTLVGERQICEGHAVHPEVVERARKMRLEQADRMRRLLEEHVLGPGKVAFLLGDFNAVASEPTINSMIEKTCGFQHLTPENDSPTHLGVGKAIDHIFVYPPGRLVSATCRVIDSPLARRASDHLPVVADVVVY